MLFVCEGFGLRDTPENSGTHTWGRFGGPIKMKRSWSYIDEIGD